MSRYLDWAQHEYPLRRRLVVLGLLAVVFLGVLPSLLVRGADRLDGRLRLPRWRAGIVNPVAGGGLVAAGALLGLTSIRAQVDAGAGTPLPMMPTQRLVVRPPFNRTRNPMTLGTLLGYGGIGVWLGSMSAIGIVATAGVVLVLYLRIFEEKELEARFGADYVEYKRTTPFLVPHLRATRATR